jgi:tetratricopeptide (TPR) repeat protein
MPTRQLAVGVLVGALLSGLALGGQEAPLLTLLSRQEQARQSELRADLYMARKSYLEAIEAYLEATRLDPRNAVLWNKTGIAYHHLFRLQDAKKHYERATKIDPQYAQAWNNLGSVAYAKKDYKKAIRHYRRALELSPAEAAIHSNLGTALFSRKQYEEAVEEYRTAMLLDPEIFERRSSVGVLLQDRSVQDWARFYFLLAKSLASLGQVEKSIAYLRRALEDGFPPAEVQADPAFLILSEDRRFQALFAAPPEVVPR